MNAAAFDAIPAAPTPASVNEPAYSLSRILAGLFLVVVTFDVCFWQVKGMGFSVAVFCPVLVLAILRCRETLAWSKSLVIACVLLLGAVLSAVVETGTTNTLVLFVLITAIAGDSFFVEAGQSWARLYSQAVAMAFAPGRIFWLGARLLQALFGKGLGWAGGILGGMLLSIPALVLALLFGSLLASGNAIFGTWTNSFFTWIWDVFSRIFNADRLILWAFIAFLTLPLLCPGRISTGWWNWIPRLPRLPEVVPTLGAIYSSALILIVVNILFFVANIADAMFLWTKNTLPLGVTYSEYVHSGVNALTITVLLSAFVLAAIFQQELKISQSRFLKALGLVWIAQNVFLIVSVMLRLKLYIEAYDMTVARLSVIIFLVLVMIGYGLLTVKIVRDKSLPWLIGGCALAVFSTLYIAQFLDLAGWSANYNVVQWEKNRSRNLDTAYLAQLGPAAWPALRRAANDDAPAVSSASTSLLTARTQEAKEPKAIFDGNSWREFSLRAWWNRAALDEK